LPRGFGSGAFFKALSHPVQQGFNKGKMMADILVKCTRCKFMHSESERKSVFNKKNDWNDLVCPKCSGKSFYDMRPQLAWCWASGLIEVGDQLPVSGPDGAGAIAIASGPKSELMAILGVVARHGRGASAGSYLVPGVPEAADQTSAGDALEDWLTWCAKRKIKSGVKFAALVKV
jgi:DNA-directed RNA polymerase subunit RPC12/RpoP